MNIYLISGLGANYRAFQYLHFDRQYTIIHIEWNKPLQDETLEQYAKRLTALIDTSKPFALIGLSFGGMIAVEMLKTITPQKTILLSSVNGYHELPWFYKLGGKLKLHKLMPARAGNTSNPLLYWLFDLKDKNHQKILSQIMAESNTTFTKWAINAIVNWKKKDNSKGIVRIHGDKDRVLPITGFTPDHVIVGGGHLMVANRAQEVSALIDDILKRLSPFTI